MWSIARTSYAWSWDIPQKRALDKELSFIDDASRRFIAHAPFVFIASSSKKGVLDISPKGDPAGFVLVLD